MDGRVEGWMDGWIDEGWLVDGTIGNRWIYGLIKGWIDG